MFYQKFKLHHPAFLSRFQPSTVLPIGFAHNDSVYNYPLLDALKSGYQYIEVDIHCINNELYVNHSRPFFLNKNKTFTKLYLEPLSYLFEKYGSIFPDSDTPLFIFLDIKTNADITYKCIKFHISKFDSMLTSWNLNQKKENAVTLILTGNRPIEIIKNEIIRKVAIDGRIEDISAEHPSQFMPFISDKYSKIFGRAFFKINPTKKELENFNTLLEKVHTQNKRFRLWGVPEKKYIWDLLLKEGLDIISTNRIDQFANYLKEK